MTKFQMAKEARSRYDPFSQLFTPPTSFRIRIILGIGCFVIRHFIRARRTVMRRSFLPLSQCVPEFFADQLFQNIMLRILR